MIKRRFFPESKIFHIFNRSISGYKVFRHDKVFQRFLETLDYYNSLEVKPKLSFVKNKKMYQFDSLFAIKNKAVVKFLSYCLMPDHYHLLIKILVSNALSKYINDVENSFTRYFNTKFKRKGPLWEGPFKAVLIRTNEQTLHVSRYIHLNPTSDGLVENPEDWEYSSYKQIITQPFLLKKQLKEISISNPLAYKKFVDNHKDYQRQLKLIRGLMLENNKTERK